ncbi:hypothetical protein DL766_008370 [Monosporascus sp. MC13-8B]|uniref:Clr5 domain-containing protein n=1 Tax=Monosporascus cannonballus TaxID=155416 RepID=A0ABY0H5B4_9PEZI|nr:hypothetical protein DL763_011327 [Monosporascus cannonballus]RYO84510.1 hypothetical protein DL762_005616 [Monosporascus cannonballus]RYP19728.1 hypothetical protein DL766_008370 [Monosporascus sp. MC13-8B]
MEPSSIAGKKQYAKPPDWIRHKPTIRRLYLDLGWTLSRVQSYMEDQHGFYATKSMYKKRLHAWRFGKNSKKDGQPTQLQQDLTKDIPLRLAVNDSSPTSNWSPRERFTPLPRAPGLSNLQRVVAVVQLYYRSSLYAVDSPNADWQRLVLGTGTADDSRTVHDKFAQLLMVRDTFAFVADVMRTRGCPSVIQMLQPLFDKLRYLVMYHNPETIICILRILEAIKLQQQSRLASILQSQCTNNEMGDVARHIQAAASFEVRGAFKGDCISSVTSFDSILDQYVILKENISARARAWLDIYHCSRAAQSRKAAPDTPVSSALPVALEHLQAGRFADAEAFVRIAYREIDSGNAPNAPPLLLTWTLGALGFVRVDTGDLESAVSLFRLAILNSERAGEATERAVVQSALQLVLDRQKRYQSRSVEYASGSARRPLEICARSEVHSFAHLFTDLFRTYPWRDMSASRSKSENESALVMKGFLPDGLAYFQPREQPLELRVLVEAKALDCKGKATYPAKIIWGIRLDPTRSQTKIDNASLPKLPDQSRLSFGVAEAADPETKA